MLVAEHIRAVKLKLKASGYKYRAELLGPDRLINLEYS